MSRPIDPNSPYVRIVFDLSTAEALAIEQLWMQSQKNKKEFYRDVFVAYIASHTTAKKAARKSK